YVATAEEVGVGAGVAAAGGAMVRRLLGRGGAEEDATSLQRLLREFADKRRGQHYAGVHLLLMSRLPEAELTALRECAPLCERLKQVRAPLNALRAAPRCLQPHTHTHTRARARDRRRRCC
ncbi:MAG: hypothetical protein ACK4ZJ_17365, partial [Allorhizobium sp.]